eukprot:scaffold191233_cov32-Prasinocladus_malaysianus.AAC.1
MACVISIHPSAPSGSSRIQSCRERPTPCTALQKLKWPNLSLTQPSTMQSTRKMRCPPVAATKADTGETPWAAPGFKGAKVSQFPDPSQAAIVAAIFGALGVGTVISCTYIGPFLESTLPIKNNVKVR